METYLEVAFKGYVENYSILKNYAIETINNLNYLDGFRRSFNSILPSEDSCMIINYSFDDGQRWTSGYVTVSIKDGVIRQSSKDINL